MKFPFWPDQKGYRNIELGLLRVYDLLARIDNPHKKLPPTIHIAGTNGKGSTIAFLRNILEKSGHSVHTYTSPHLVEFNERIILAGKKISDEFLNECLETCRQACLQEPKIEPTFFEGITAAAFLAFSKVEADFLLLEVGMGGRLDATNVIEKNLCAIITPISFDHTEFLGDTLAKIAFEKASIIKKNCPVFVGKQEPEALEVIKNYAKKMNSSIKIFGQDFDCEILENNWNFLEKNNEEKQSSRKNLGQKWRKKLTLPFPSLLAGTHQINNAALALAVILSQNLLFVKKNRQKPCKTFNFKAFDSIKNYFLAKKIKLAIASTSWLARLQKINSGIFFEKIPAKSQLFLDGSHNAQGAKTVREFLQNHKNRKRILIFSMLQDKDCSAFLNEIKNEVDFLIAMEIEDEPKSRKSYEIVKIANDLGIKNCQVANFDEAFAKTNSWQRDDKTLILVCGSLYLAGDFLAKNKS